jgi:hypothetical protein
MGPINSWIRDFIETYKKPKMIDIIPYFAGFITLLFAVACVLALNKYKGYK